MNSDFERQINAAREHAQNIADQTSRAKRPSNGGWVSDDADPAEDVLTALDPDVAFGWAHRRAMTAVRMCDEADLEMAQAFLAEAKAHYTRGLEASVDRRMLEARLIPKKRGAGGTAQRDRDLYEAASKLIAVDNSLGIAAACRAALASDDTLTTAFRGVTTDRTLERAFRRGERQ